MKKKVIFLTIILLVFATCFIPFTQHKTVTVKAFFFNTYQQLFKAENWKQWRTDFRRAYLADSTKVSVRQQANSFQLGYDDQTLEVNIVNGYTFDIAEKTMYQSSRYSYTILPDKDQNKISVIVSQRTNLVRYLFNRISGKKAFSDTHIDDLKNFMEDADLYYGVKITKESVTDTSVLVLRRMVSAKDKFTEAEKSLVKLNQFASANDLKQTLPLIAQFLPGNKDSIMVNVGLPINKKVPANKPIDFMEMPKAHVYIVKYHGRFNERSKAYASAKRFFADRNIPMLILPFETYLDNKLPKNDLDTVNIQINFATY